jgi:hypothetical protein
MKHMPDVQHTCMHECVCVCARARACVCAQTRCVRAQFKCVLVCRSVLACRSECACLRIWMTTRVSEYTHIHTHTHTHTYTRTHTTSSHPAAVCKHTARDSGERTTWQLRIPVWMSCTNEPSSSVSALVKQRGKRWERRWESSSKHASIVHLPLCWR